MPTRFAWDRGVNEVNVFIQENALKCITYGETALFCMRKQHYSSENFSQVWFKPVWPYVALIAFTLVSPARPFVSSVK